MIRFALNTKKFNTYAFFCPVSRLHLTLSNPVGVSNRVTPAILRGLKSKTILDIDNAVDMTTGAERVLSQEETKEPVPEVPETIEEPKEPVAETEIETEAQETTEEAVAKKTRKKSVSAPETEK